MKNTFRIGGGLIKSQASIVVTQIGADVFEVVATGNGGSLSLANRVIAVLNDTVIDDPHFLVASATTSAAPKVHPDQNIYFGKREAADYIGVSLRTLDRLDIPRFKVRNKVKFRKTAIDEWSKAHEGFSAESRKYAVGATP
jgi:hypothetical protein